MQVEQDYALNDSSSRSYETAVATNISTRAAERSRGELQPREFKTALVIQGGTLRSVASCGAAAALNRLGLTNAFDTVYGGSSGAVNGAYFLTDQAALGVTVYLDDVNNRRFLNFLRPWKMIDLEFFFNEIVKDRKQHDLSKLQHHPTPLRIITTDLITGETVWFSSHDTTVDLYDALRAACALPLVYGRGVHIGQYRCVDGYIKEPLPVLTALHQDYTDILVLMTNHISVRHPLRPPLLERLTIEPAMRLQLGEVVYSQYRTRNERYNNAADIVQRGEYVRPNGSKTRIAYVCPDLAAQVHRFELGRDALAAAAYSSWANTLALFGETTANSYEAFTETLDESIRRNQRRTDCARS